MRGTAAGGRELNLGKRASRAGKGAEPYDKREDYLLLKRFAGGDEAAFAELYDRYAGRLVHYVYRCVHDWQEAEDIVQEVFVQVMKDADTFQPKASLSTWLFRIATFMCLKRKRDRGIHSRILNREAEAGTFSRDNPETGGAQEVLRRERVEAIKELVDHLPEEHRSVFVLREYEDMSYSQIAEVMGIEMGTVKSRLFRARELLREGLQERDLL